MLSICLNLDLYRKWTRPRPYYTFQWSICLLEGTVETPSGMASKEAILNAYNSRVS
jgi:hypothetical protein